MSTTTVYLLYFAFALGGAGLYFLMPRAGRSRAMVGVVFGIAAIVALLGILAIRVVSPDPTTPYFYLFATIAIVAASRVITHTKPVYSALYFVLVVIAVAALLVLLRAEFLAIALVLVYAGAIMVTYLFVIMLAQQGGSSMCDERAREPFLAVFAGFLLMAAIAVRAADVAPGLPPSPVEAHRTVETSGSLSVSESNTAGMGLIVMTRYIVVLEISGVLLLVAMIGAIALSRKRVPIEGTVPPSKPLGQVGKEVAPY